MNGGRTEMKKQQQPVRSAAVYDGREQIGSVVLARATRLGILVGASSVTTRT
jgi:hypothetical protein